MTTKANGGSGETLRQMNRRHAEEFKREIEAGHYAHPSEESKENEMTESQITASGTISGVSEAERGRKTSPAACKRSESPFPADVATIRAAIMDTLDAGDKHSRSSWLFFLNESEEATSTRVRFTDAVIARITQLQQPPFVEQVRYNLRRLLALADTAPHECEDPECPGVVNKAVLEQFDALRKAAEDARAWICRVTNEYAFGADDPHDVLAALRKALGKEQ